jgi:class 3 adenylate cyclase
MMISEVVSKFPRVDHRLQGRTRPGLTTRPYRQRMAVLFADISGFTELVETAPPEIVYQVVRPLMDRLVLLVRHHGGEIQQVLGDGFMAVFGLYTVRGDEAQRAIGAGLALLAAARHGDPAVHVGIEYGQMLVTSSWETALFGVWGRPVTIAQRLCDAAGPGELQIGPTAFTTAETHIGPSTPVCARLKGITDTVIAHRMIPAEYQPIPAG